MKALLALLGGLLLSATATAASLRQEPMRLDTGTGVLHGTLLLPGTQRVPVALIIAGSGPTDRDGNSPMSRNDTLKKLAEGLARQGIASLRYDKRGVAASLQAAPDERSLSVERYVEDAQAWIRRLSQDPRFSEVVLIGHSEGALIASLAAAQGKVAALVTLAGSGRPIDQVLREQLQTKLPPPLMATSNWLLDELQAGRTHDEIPPALMALFRPSVQPYLISLLRQDPARAFAATRVPALIVQGGRDIQVDVADAQDLARARPQARLLVIPSMNHLLRLQSADEDPLASYSQPQRPLAPAVFEAIDGLLKSTSRPSGAQDRADKPADA